MSKVVKKNIKSVAAAAAAVASINPISVKKVKSDTSVAVPKKKQVNPATLPPLAKEVDVGSLKSIMLATQKSIAARAKYEEFVNNLDLAEYPGNFDRVSFGDLLNVTPSLPSNKRKLESMLETDEKVAAVYEEAQEIYQSLLNKTENAKISDFAKRKKLAQKKTVVKKEKNVAVQKEETVIQATQEQAAEPVVENPVAEAVTEVVAESAPIQETIEVPKE